MMAVDNGGYRVDKNVQKIIDIVDKANTERQIYESIRAGETNETAQRSNPKTGGIYTNREGREATKRWLNRHRDPERVITTAKAGAMLLVPEYYFLSSSIYHSAAGEPEKAALDLGGVFLGRFLGKLVSEGRVVTGYGPRGRGAEPPPPTSPPVPGQIIPGGASDSDCPNANRWRACH